MTFLNSSAVRILTVVLLLQAVAFYAVANRAEATPMVRPLVEFPIAIGPWFRHADFPMEKEVQDVLRADDTLTRLFVNPGEQAQATLFMAFFRTQRTGQAPHSPRNCLPGSGWEPSATGTIAIPIPAMGGRQILINRYIVSRGNDKSVVLYWYQSHNRVIAGELAGKFWLVADAIRYRRSDTALVRVTVPVRNRDEDTAVANATRFVQEVFPAISHHLPH